MPWPIGRPSPRKGTGRQTTVVCPCGIVFSFRTVKDRTKQYCSLKCSYKYSIKRGRKPGCEPWNKGLIGIYEAWNKGVPCSEEAKENLRNFYAGQAITRYGRGGEPSPTMLLYKDILCPLGYEMDAVTIPIPTGSAYTLDFAHREAKVNIEIDGKMHNDRKEQDARRDAYLRNLGWRVIRIRHA